MQNLNNVIDLSDRFFKLAKTSPEILYHGTGLQKAESILSNGLLSEIPNKEYLSKINKNPQTFEGTHGGLYLTKNLKIAVEYAFINTNPCIVVCKIHPNELYLDEDCIIKNIDHDYDQEINKLISSIQKEIKYEDDDKFNDLLIEKLESKFINKCIDNFEKSFNIKFTNLNQDVIFKTKNILKEMFSISKKYKKTSGSNIDYEKQLSNDNRYQLLIDDISKLLKSAIAKSFSINPNSNVTVRTNNNISFTGSNKILAIYYIDINNKTLKPIFEDNEFKNSIEYNKLLTDYNNLNKDLDDYISDIHENVKDHYFMTHAEEILPLDPDHIELCEMYIGQMLNTNNSFNTTRKNYVNEVLDYVRKENEVYNTNKYSSKFTELKQLLIEYFTYVFLNFVSYSSYDEFSTAAYNIDEDYDEVTKLSKSKDFYGKFIINILGKQIYKPDVEESEQKLKISQSNLLNYIKYFKLFK